MTSKHTPGPWQIRTSAKGYPYQIEAPNGSRGPGGITCVTRWGAIGFPTSSEGQANARLIAAAPDLLEALKVTLRRYVELANSGDCGFWDPEIEKHVIAARAAIAKVEGRS